MTHDWDLLRHARSLLFVPGDRPERFAKAAASGADGIILDVEDAVAPGAKPRARENIRRWLDAGGSGIIRINDEDTPWHDADVAALAREPRAIMLPKVRTPDHVLTTLRQLAPGSCILPLIETAAGVLGVREICSVPGVIRAVFGNADLGRELGVHHANRAALAVARSITILASAACGLPPPVDGVTTSLTNEQEVIADADHAVTLGFSGKLCLHPRQVPLVNAAFNPSEESIRWAQEVVAAADDGSVRSVENQVVGRPIVERARRLLAQVERAVITP